MKMRKILVTALTLSLLLSGMLVTVRGEATDGEERVVESIEGTELQSVEIHDWHDLNNTRENLTGDYILMSDLDENTVGYEDYNLRMENYEIRESAGSGETWEEGDMIEIYFDEEYYESVLSVEDDFGNHINHTVGTDYITIEEDTRTSWIYVTYENAVVGWAPIGDYDREEDLGFNGTFDGNGYEITDLYIDRPEGSNNVGLFGYIEDEAEITNLGLVNAKISGGGGMGPGSVGALVGTNYGNINNSYVGGDVNGDFYVGGLAGRNSGILNNSHSISNVNGGRSGGLIGDNDGSVENSYATGDVSGNNGGGLLGSNSGIVNNSYATGKVSGNWSAGGLIGLNWGGAVENSYVTGDVSGDVLVGGLLGDNTGTVSNSYYNIDEVLINGGHHITIGGLFKAQYQDWIEDKTLDISDYSDTLVLEDDYYQISCVDGLQDILGFAWEEEYKFRLTENIDLSGEQGLYIPYLAADFDGNNNTISNLNLDKSVAGHIGMFGYVDGGRIANISIVDAKVSGPGGSVGGLVGTIINGTVSASYATGEVNEKGDQGLFSAVGGLIGINGGTVSTSYATVEVIGNDSVRRNFLY